MNIYALRAIKDQIHSLSYDRCVQTLEGLESCLYRGRQREQEGIKFYADGVEAEILEYRQQLLTRKEVAINPHELNYDDVMSGEYSKLDYELCIAYAASLDNVCMQRSEWDQDYSDVMALLIKIDERKAEIQQAEAEASQPDADHAQPANIEVMDDCSLADMIGALDIKIKALQTQLNQAKQEVKTRGIDEATGRAFMVKIGEAVRSRLDTSAAKKALGIMFLRIFYSLKPVSTFKQNALGDEWCKAHEKISIVTSINIKPIAAPH